MNLHVLIEEKIIRKIALYFLCVIMIFTLTSCKSEKNITKFVSIDGKYEVTAEGWESYEGQLNPDAILEVGKGAKEQYLIIIADSKVDLDMTFDEYNQIVIESTSAAFNDVEVGEQISIEIDNKKAYVTSINGTIDKIKSSTWMYTVDCEDDYIQIFVTTVRSEAKENEPVFKKVAESFREIKE